MIPDFPLAIFQQRKTNQINNFCRNLLEEKLADLGHSNLDKPHYIQQVSLMASIRKFI